MSSVRMSFEAWASVRMSLEVRMLVCPLNLEHEPNDTITHCHMYADGFIAKFFSQAVWQ